MKTSFCQYPSKIITLLFLFFQLISLSQIDSLTNLQIDKSIINSTYFRFNDNALELSKGKLLYSGYQITVGHLSYGLPKNLSVESGLYQLPYVDDVILLGLKVKKTFHISKNINLALKPAFITSGKRIDGFMDAIVTYGNYNNNVSLSYSPIIDLNSLKKNGNIYTLTILAYVSKHISLETDFNYSEVEEKLRKEYILNFNIGIHYYFKNGKIGFGYQNSAYKSHVYLSDNIPIYAVLKIPLKL